jgi:hypothetical protein
MRGIPADLPLGRFIGQDLIQVALGQFQIPQCIWTVKAIFIDKEELAGIAACRLNSHHSGPRPSAQGYQAGLVRI